MATKVTALKEFKDTWLADSIQDSLKSTLPPHINRDRFNSVVFMALSVNPELLKLNRQSLFNACLLAATDGLLPDKREAALVKFKEEVKYMPMVSGVLKKIRNSGELGMIDSAVVYEKDTYEAWIDEKGP